MSHLRARPAILFTRAPLLPNPQLDEHGTVVGELIPHRFVGLAVGDVAEGRAIDPGHDPLVDDEVIDELRLGSVSPTDNAPASAAARSNRGRVSLFVFKLAPYTSAYTLASHGKSDEGFNQVVMSIFRALLYCPL
jgi:hypothetical protein